MKKKHANEIKRNINKSILPSASIKFSSCLILSFLQTIRKSDGHWQQEAFTLLGRLLADPHSGEVLSVIPKFAHSSSRWRTEVRNN